MSLDRRVASLERASPPAVQPRAPGTSLREFLLATLPDMSGLPPSEIGPRVRSCLNAMTYVEVKDLLEAIEIVMNDTNAPEGGTRTVARDR